MSTLVPDDFPVPSGFSTSDFVVRPLRTRDVYLDYIAVMTSLDIIRRTRGGHWPPSDLTFEQDLIDLAWHEKEFQNRTSFAFTVMRPDERECVGCVYLNPGGYRGHTTTDCDVDVSFWVTQAAYDEGMYPRLFSALDTWMKSWPFQSVGYSNAKLPSALGTQ